MLFSSFEQNFQKKAEAVSTQETNLSQKTVILDPGHGGVDSGTVSVLGDEEKDINLSVAKALGQFLEAAGIRVLYTRTDDTMLTSNKTSSRKLADLIARVDLAKEHPDATFVSIHMNSLPIEKYKGLQVFYSTNHPTSKVLALQLQNDTKQILQPENQRQITDPKGSIYILDRIVSPAVLIECGFLSNYEDARNLTDQEYQSKLAFTLSRSIISFVLQRENLE